MLPKSELGTHFEGAVSLRYAICCFSCMVHNPTRQRGGEAKAKLFGFRLQSGSGKEEKFPRSNGSARRQGTTNYEAEQMIANFLDFEWGKGVDNSHLFSRDAAVVACA